VTAPRHIAKYTPENVASEAGGRLRSPSFERNFAPIRDALRPLIGGREGTVLEIGSGTGHHIAHLAQAFPELSWAPSDIHDSHHASIAAWGESLGCTNLGKPLFLDAATDWPGDQAVRTLAPITAILCCNVIHIAPWAVTEGLVSGAAQALEPGGMLILYGPFREGGRHTGAGNASFDAGLRAENPDWGVRDLDEVAALAAAAGFGPAQIARLPSNNLLVAFTRA
jgi:SAM-dependent methyltransferase